MNVTVAKLARTLGVDAGQLDFLTTVPDADLREFRHQVAEMLSRRQSGGLSRIAAAARVVPAPIAARLIGRTRNPLLAARVSGLLEPDHAVDIARRLPVDFLAEIAARIDPAHAARLIGRLPAKTVVAVAQRLAAQEDWITLADLVTVVPLELAHTTVATLDDAAVACAAPFIDDESLREQLLGKATG